MAKPGTGEAVETGIRKASDLAETGIGALGDHLGVLDVVSSLVGGAIDLGANAAGPAVNAGQKAKIPFVKGKFFSEGDGKIFQFVKSTCM